MLACFASLNWGMEQHFHLVVALRASAGTSSLQQHYLYTECMVAPTACTSMWVERVLFNEVLAKIKFWKVLKSNQNYFAHWMCPARSLMFVYECVYDADRQCDIESQMAYKLCIMFLCQCFYFFFWSPGLVMIPRMWKGVALQYET